MNTYYNHRAEPYFTFLKNGQKTIEGRIAKGKYSHIAAGDTIVVSTIDETDSVKVIVRRVTLYPTIAAMLRVEDLKKVLPDAESEQQGIAIYRQFYSETQEAEFGVVAIEVEVV